MESYQKRTYNCERNIFKRKKPSTMALFNKNGLKIVYNTSFNRLAITCAADFVSISPEIFQIWKKVSELDSDYEKLTIDQNGSTIEILKLCGNISLKFISCKNFASQIILREDTVKAIFRQYNHIITSIYKKRITSQVVKPIGGIVKPLRASRSSGDVGPQKRSLSRATPVVRRSISPDNPSGDVGPQKRRKPPPIASSNQEEEEDRLEETQISAPLDSSCETVFNE